MLELKNIELGYHDTLLTGVNQVYEKGKLYGITGLNGCGKSTLLRAMVNEHRLKQGEIRIDDKTLSSYSHQELATRITYSSNRYQTFGNTTCEDIVSMGRIPYLNLLGTMTQSDKEVVKISIEKLGIKHLQQRRFGTLSDGERQKTILAKCLAQTTDIILLDEPMAFLDHPARVDLYSLLRSLSINEEKLIIMTGHEPQMLKDNCHEVLLISERHLLNQSSSLFNKKWVSFNKT